MAQLLVRGIDVGLVRLLKIRAAENGNSAEEEHRRILRQVLGVEESRQPLKELLAEIPGVGEDADFERSSERSRPVDL